MFVLRFGGVFAGISVGFLLYGGLCSQCYRRSQNA